ncbi:hypothetical protein EMPG_15656 [Blastomyces silverae]|uniref:FAD dependent oxidoreductase domain-containing protein n=1 Tax=Blastomyces silverae TaxID=2060906 RepID=A0A0H1BD25_9EURO|nr:hypothetical protein EMPG_15656 [Blastomyces silverae]
MPPSSEPDIVVIDSSRDICSGASSEAMGRLGDFGFRAETAPLGIFSYKLHKELASKYNGRGIYKFSDLEIFRASPKNFTGNPSPPDTTWGPSPPSLAEAPYAAHLDDARQSFTGVTVQMRDETRTTHTIPCRAVVIAAGPWSTRVFSHLFPAGHLNLRMDSTNSAENHVLVRNPRWTPAEDENRVTQVFLLNNVGNDSNRLDITSFLGGYLYMYTDGWGVKPEGLPEFAEGVQGQPDEIDAMLEMTRQYLRLEANEELEIVKAGRCYRPLAVPNIPTIAKVNWEMLGDSKPKLESEAPLNGFRQHGSPVVGGLNIPQYRA